MKKFIFASLLAFAACFDAAAQEYKVVTVVESIVPGGVGRSRIIEATSEVDSDSATTERIDGKKSDQGKVKRGDQKIEAFKETKLTLPASFSRSKRVGSEERIMCENTLSHIRSL